MHKKRKMNVTMIKRKYLLLCFHNSTKHAEPFLEDNGASALQSEANDEAAILKYFFVCF